MPVRKFITVEVVHDELTRHVTDCMEERKETTFALKALEQAVNSVTTISAESQTTLKNYEHVFSQINKSFLWLMRAIVVGIITVIASIGAQEFMRHQENTVTRRENLQDQNHMASAIVNAVKDKQQ